MVLRFFLLAGVFFLMSCMDAERDNPYDMNSDNYRGTEYLSSSSNSIVVSSSSVTTPSSSATTPSSSSVSLCNGIPYNPATQFCYNDSKVENKCGNRTEVFDSDLDKCVDDRGVSKIYLKTPVSYENESYEAVLIGTQTWFARNLNYEPSTGNFSCYDNKPANCDTYGYLYDWATAMDLSSSCSNLSCSYSLPRKGICPEGWHLPSDAEWTQLTDFVGGSSTAGTKLKAASGWHIGSDYKPGVDEYGFTALPGGNRSDGTFFSVDNYGYWWSATESRASNAWYRYMYYNYTLVGRNDSIRVNGVNTGKSLYLSVRCIRNTSYIPSYSSAVTSSSSAPSSSSMASSSSVSLCNGIPYNPATQFCYNDSKIENKCGNRTEIFDSDLYKCVDDRGVSKIYLKTPVSYENESYEAVLIGTQTWLAKNLNYYVEGSECYYGYLENNCSKYGRLYDWAMAMDLSSSCSNLSCSYSLPRKGICPEGWHIPSNAEWDALITAVGGSSKASNHLKTTNGWGSDSKGTDTYSFSALPGGRGLPGGDFSTDEGSYGFWWSTSEYDGNKAYRLYIRYNSEISYQYYESKLYLFSVRCIKDY